MLLADLTPQRHFAGVGISVLLHGALLSGLLFAPGITSPQNRSAPDSRQYSVLVLHLNRPLPRETAVANSAGVRRRIVPFVAPAESRVRQTLIEPDIPPSIRLASEIPLPNLTVWSDLSRVHREFVEPPAVKPQPTAKPELSPVAPAFEQRTDTSQMVLLAAHAKGALVFAAPPVSAAGSSSAPLIIDVPAPDAAGQSGAGIPAIFSQSDLSALVPGPIAIPPANQMAGSGSHDGNGLNGSREMAAETRAGIGTNGSRETAGESRGGNRGNGTQESATAAAISELPIPGTTRLTLPKQGSFGLVVTGSSVSAPYAESIGALSGRVIYSVYLPVELPKKWILEYCIPRDEEEAAATPRTGVLDAPWPWVMVRPNDLGTSSQDYLVVHGVLTAQGRFDQLAMVFPQNPRRKDLLFASLRQWTFRPAARDGVPASVEVLLIIPGQPD